MTVPTLNAWGHLVYMQDGDLGLVPPPPEPPAVMTAADLGLEPPPRVASAGIKLESEGLKGRAEVETSDTPAPRVALIDDPERLAAACRQAGIIDAMNNRPLTRAFIIDANQAAYVEGYEYETRRQKVVRRG